MVKHWLLRHPEHADNPRHIILTINSIMAEDNRTYIAIDKKRHNMCRI